GTVLCAAPCDVLLPPLHIPGASAEARFATLPPGSALPSGAECAARMHRRGWEPRPENAAANETPGVTGVRIDGAGERGQELLAARIDGAFSGTTDEIIQWAAC